MNRKNSPTNIQDSDYQALASLGITFFSTPDFSIPPESVLAHVLDKENFIGNKIYSLLKLFFSEFHDLIRVDLLIKESEEISPIGKATISALALYSLKILGDKRFKKFKLAPLDYELVLTKHSSESNRGVEKELMEMGIVVRKLGEQPGRKIRDIKWLISNNIWLRNRLLMGVGVRADSFSALELEEIETYYSLSKVVKSSVSAARKNFKDYHLLNDI